MMMAMSDMDANPKMQKTLEQLENDIAEAMDEKCKEIFIRT